MKICHKKYLGVSRFTMEKKRERMFGTINVMKIHFQLETLVLIK